MKYTLIAAALVGSLTFEEVNAITLFTTNGQVAYVAKSDSESSSSSSSSSTDAAKKPAKKALVELGDDVDHSGEFFQQDNTRCSVEVDTRDKPQPDSLLTTMISS